MELTPRQLEIIDAALELVARHGIQALTIKNVAEAIHVTEPAIYRHFRSKSELIRTLIDSFDCAVEIPDSLPGWEAVCFYIRSRIRQIIQAPHRARVVFAEELFMNDPQFTEQFQQMMHRHQVKLSAQLAAAQKSNCIVQDIAPEMLFRMIFGAVRLLIKQWAMSGYAFDLQQESEALLDSFSKLLVIKN